MSLPSVTADGGSPAGRHPTKTSLPYGESPSAVDSWLIAPVESGVKAGFGLYLHVPFCAHRCGYCDFATSDRHGHLMGRYVAALGEEIRRAAADRDCPALTSIFVGGGTPTLLPAADLASILRLVAARFPLASDVEATVEANPETVDPGYLTTLAEAGVNRLSLGAQSFAPHVLQTLERRHAVGAVEAAIVGAREAGLDNVGLDLIYGTPGESEVDWDSSLRRVLDLGVDHVSAYALTVHANTRLGRQVAEGRVPAPDPDLQRRRFERAREVLGGAGFDHYEISNWARTPRHRSRHNVLYWRHGDYLGIGVGAHGHLDGHRYWGHRSIERWIDAVESGRPPVAGEERLSVAERADERLLLGLRLREGLHALDTPPLDAHALQAAADDGLVELSCGRVQASDAGWYLLDTVLARLLG